jgi:hypothetical protein
MTGQTDKKCGKAAAQRLPGPKGSPLVILAIYPRPYDEAVTSTSAPNASAYSHPLSLSTRWFRGVLAGAAIVVSALSLSVVWGLELDNEMPTQAENLRSLVTVLVGLAIFTVIVSNWKQLGAMGLSTVVSVLLITSSNWDPTLITVINLVLSAIVTFYGANVRTIFK